MDNDRLDELERRYADGQDHLAQIAAARRQRAPVAPPITDAAIDAARERARREDGHVDPFALAVELSQMPGDEVAPPSPASEWIAVVDSPSGRETMRVTARREYCPEIDRGVWHAKIDHPAGEGWSIPADKREECAVLSAVMNPGAAWRWRLVSLARVEAPPR